jgi:formylglycine-generating enzyme required for sulfatase activity
LAAKKAEREKQLALYKATLKKIGEKPFTVPGLSMEMLWCAPGAFEMGSPLSERRPRPNERQHTVTLTRGFWLGKHEVTQTQWEKVMSSNPSKFKGANLPVEDVSWNDATSFCKKLTERERKADRLPMGSAYQLPTEAQWEHACRAGTKTAFSFGDDLSSRQVNFGNEIRKTTAVGSYPANAWGFHDLHGNVYEWCQDWYGDYPSGSVRDPMGPADGSKRVARGGSWHYGTQDLRSADRSSFVPDYRYHIMGFRPSLRLDDGRGDSRGRSEAGLGPRRSRGRTSERRPRPKLTP